ncbi:hypothetical protein KVV02_000975 [Mortierella alpina]|uniref:Uncharacterized protein n=1 Tax=Mortierella alpina TaxID=64518 RepID=A0A9P8D1Z6_MORAP|nr:hypothetical protein KVV02_000975 [Mortierella alpina]
MSQRKGAANSKFGHLFGDTSDSSTGSSKSNRLSISGDLYKDPLAAFNPPITASTTTTRGGAAAAKATLSSPPASSSAAAAAAAGPKTPPGSGPNSRSSSRLQHHALFSSLTGDSGGSLFDSAPQSASLTLSAAKRDLLFGDSGGPTSSSSASRKTSTTLSRSSNSSSRVPSPPLGVRVSTTALNADASPLGESASASNKDEDAQSIKSPLSTQSLTRTNSQASTISHESVKSSRSVQSQDTADDARSIASSTRSGIPSKVASVVSTSVAPPAVSAPPLSSKTSISTRPPAIKRASVDQPSKQSAPTAPTIVDPIFNPLDQSQPQSIPSSEPQSPRLSKDKIPHSASSTTSSQSIETFQSISRTSSPNFAPPPLSKNGFERDAENASPAPSTSSSFSRSEAMNLVIPDDAAEAFANDLLFTSGPTSPQISSTLGHRSTSFLDSGIASSRSQHQPSISDTLSNINSLRTTVQASKPGAGAGTVSHPRTGSGFSLGEDVVDSSNPWMNSLADSLQETKLLMVEGGGNKVMDYTHSDDMGEPNFAQEAAFALPSTSTLSRRSNRNNFHSTSTTITSNIGSHYPSSLLTPIPTLEEDLGGFDDVFSSTRSKPNAKSTTAAMASSPTLALSTHWNIRDAVEAAALDPDFQGPRSIVNQSRDKVLAIMQMPKDPLEKDASDQEAFDNPWE